VPARRLLLVLAALAALPAAAQPDPGAVVDAWRADWRRASTRVQSVEAQERTEWTIDGPRGRTRIEVEADIRFDLDAPPQRDVRRVRSHGRDMPAERGRGHGRRWQRAFGPAGREVQAPPDVPGAVLGSARAVGIAADRLDGTLAWRVALQSSEDRTEAWFTRGARPRLLAMRFEGQRPRGGRIVREVRYVRVDGLDLPASASTTFTALQRRRLREFHVTLTAEATYDRHSVR